MPGEEEASSLGISQLHFMLSDRGEQVTYFRKIIGF